jgi:hypothetical protein
LFDDLRQTEEVGEKHRVAEARLIWVGLFRHGLGRAIPCQSQINVRVRIKINVKGVGQECPTHMGKVKGFHPLEAQAAVYGENLAGDELRGGGEEENGGGDFVVASVTLHGSLFGHLAHECRG